MLSDDISDDDSFDDEEKCDGVYAEPTEDYWQCGECDDRCCSEVDATDSCFQVQDAVGWGKVKSSTHIRRKWKNVLTKLPGVISQAR
jgi:hypothetical protein